MNPLRPLPVLVAALITASLAAACGSIPTALADDTPPKPKVELQIKSWEETLKLVASKKGKIVVLDAWSTSCEPCVEEFPNLVALHKKHGKHVACISLSCDYVGIKNKPPEYYREKVLKFLTKQEAEFDNLLCNEEADVLFQKMDLASIPAVYVFGRDGKLVKRFDNDSIKDESEVFTYKDVTALVEKLLADDEK